MKTLYNKLVTWVSLKLHLKYSEKNYPYIAELEDALKYKDEIIFSLSKSEDELMEELNDCQHQNTSESMNSIKLKEALELLIKGIEELPPLTAIQGALAEEVQNAKQTIRKVENSWGWHNEKKTDEEKGVEDQKGNS